MPNEYTCSIKPPSTDDEIHMLQMEISALMELTFWRAEL